jgi:hypothetical protein
MLTDLAVLKEVGTTDEALRKLFTAEAPPETMPEGPEKKAKRELRDMRKKFEDLLSSELNQNIHWCLRNYNHYLAVDLAWDTPVITKEMVPLQLLAQGKLDIAQCTSQLARLNCAGEFLKKKEDGKLELNVPKFFEVSANLMRSYLNRRVAAQSNKFGNLWPYYKFEPRSMSPVSRMRSEMFSQRVDMMSDDFDWRHHDKQCYRDALMYGWICDFPRSKWERDIGWVSRPKVEGEIGVSYDAKTMREGIKWIKVHPSRTYWDLASPLADINSDAGPEFIGFWDVWKYKDVNRNTEYWNRSAIGFSAQYLNLFATFGQYFSAYYTTINAPIYGQAVPLGLRANDRQDHVGRYTDDQGDTAIIVAVHYKKIVPKEWGLGDYPYPTWVRLIVAGFDTVIHAQWLGTAPGAYLGINQKDDRLLSPGLGHDLLPLQDQMSNLLSYLLLSLKGDNIKVLVLDIDCLSAEQIQDIRSKAKGQAIYGETQILEVSRNKLANMGLKVEDVIQLVETRSSAQINLIFQAMINLLSLTERLIALSPQEMGQPAKMEISATEANLIAGTTEAIYNDISDAIDEWRAAKKRIVYESYVNHAEPDFVLPAIHKYSRKTIEEAGFELAEDTDLEDFGNGLVRGNILGPKSKLLSFSQIFTSKDGAERTSNAGAAERLSEVLKSVLPLQPVQESMTKGQLKDVLNEFFRLTGAYDMKLEEGPDDDQPISPAASEQLQGMLEGLTGAVERHDSILQQLTAPPPNANPPQNPTGPPI